MYQDWELMTDTCAHIVLGWSAGEMGSYAAQRLQESVAPEVARAALTAMGTFDVADLQPQQKEPILVLHRSEIAWSRSISLARRPPGYRMRA